MEPRRRSPFALVAVSLYYYYCLFSSLSSSFTNVVIFRIPRATTFSTTLIQYTDDHTPTPFSEKVPGASPYKALLPKETVPLPTAPLVLPRPKPAMAVPVASSKVAAAAAATKPPPRRVAEKKDELSLYEVLGVPPTATREEMKRRYNVLVKKHHPDAVKHRPPPRLMFVGPGSAAHSFSASRQSQQGPQTPIKKEPDFGEITAAWAVLSDDKARRKYDRGLLYQKWADQASKLAMKTMEDAAPVMAKMMDNVAVPLMETTAVSTAKIAKAAYRRMGESIITTPPDVVTTASNVKGTIKLRPPPAPPSVVPPLDDVAVTSSISMNEVVSQIALPPRPATTKPPVHVTAPFFSDPVIKTTSTTATTTKKKKEAVNHSSSSETPRGDTPTKRTNTKTTKDAMKLPLWTLLLQMILFV